MTFRFALAAIALVLFGAVAARAETVVKTDQVRAELIAEQNTVAPGGSVWVGLSLDIIPGWHTYWRTTGDSGFPTQITWVLPAGVTAGEIQWPVPERVPYGDLMNYGYHSHVTLLTEMKIDPNAARGDAIVKADVTWLVCADVCIPQDGSFALPLRIDPAAPKQTTAAAANIEAARASVPVAAPWPVKAARSGDTITITAAPGVVKNVAFLPYQEGLIVNAAPQDLSTSGDALTLKLKADKGAEKYGDVAGVLTLTDASGTTRGYSFNAPIVWTAPGQSNDVSLALALLLALAGGLILNVMPCVLPVLAMKALSFARANTNARELRRDGLAYTAGVMAAFAALAGALLAARSAGATVGWGFQLQSPIFVAVLAYIMLLMGLNLSGVFQINGPMNAGEALTRQSGPAGAFFTGLLAVLVATPCTAPFMGAAMGFALTQSAATAFAVFMALALGLALPFLALSFAPGLARRIPRPGLWMERLKQILAFPMYATAAWLVWVLAQQLDPTGLAAAFAGAVSVAFAAWLWGVAQVSAARGQRLSTAAAAIMLIATGGFVVMLGDSPAPAAAAAQAAPGNLAGEPYSAARIAALQAEGRPVFVDFTAAWCLTCIVNERVALAAPDVSAAFKARNVAYMKADWTNRNSEISAALRALGRDGVPLYALYQPSGNAPKILPQILTPAIILDALAGI